jgi:arylsulfatase
MAKQEQRKPNILILWGDDIGYWNVSAYNQGMMGYKTPNIDRIAKEGALFTDWYGQQSCTAGRACFITGQSAFRTGLTKVGLPGFKEGLQARDVTIAELLKAPGYMTAQFGKNHLGDAETPCPPRTASTSSWARSTTSTPRKSSRTRTTSKIPS